MLAKYKIAGIKYLCIPVDLNMSIAEAREVVQILMERIRDEHSEEGADLAREEANVFDTELADVIDRIERHEFDDQTTEDEDDGGDDGGW